jgi:replication factor C subunit 1
MNSKLSQNTDIKFINKSIQLWDTNDELQVKYNNSIIEHENISTELNTSSLWTEKYRPTKFTDYYITKSQLKIINEWIDSFVNHTQEVYKPVLLLYGTAGIGKTTLAHLIFKKYKYDIIEINASDVRNKKQIKELIGKISLFSVNDLKNKKSVGLIMDEIDGMLGGDIGGINEFVNLISFEHKKSPKKLTTTHKTQTTTNDNILENDNLEYPKFPYKFPVIATCNTIKDSKLQQLLKYSVVIKLSPPLKSDALSLINKICNIEHLNIPENIKESIIDNDYRKIINTLYQIALSNKLLDKSIPKIISNIKVDNQDYININGDTLVERIIKLLNIHNSKLDMVKFTDCSMYLMGLYYNTIPILAKIQSQLKRYSKEKYLEDINKLIKIYHNFIISDQFLEYSYKFQNWDLAPYIEQIGIIYAIRYFYHAMNGNNINLANIINHYHPYNYMRQEQSNNQKITNNIMNCRCFDTIEIFYDSENEYNKKIKDKYKLLLDK